MPASASGAQIDLDVDVFPLIVLRVPQANVLQLDLELMWGLERRGGRLLRVHGEHVLVLHRTHLLQEGQINWGKFLAGLAMPVSFTTALLIAHDQAAGQVQLPPEWKPVGSSGTKYRLQQPFDFGQGALAAVTLEGVHGLPAGPILGGSIATVAALQDPNLFLFMDFAEFTWEIVDRCADTLILATRASVTLNNVNPSPVRRRCQSPSATCGSSRVRIPKASSSRISSGATMASASR